MDIITLYDENNNKKDYKVLLVINDEYKYIIYTDIDNKDLRNNLMVAKVKSLDNLSETLQINQDEWKYIENKYKEIIK